MQLIQLFQHDIIQCERAATSAKNKQHRFFSVKIKCFYSLFFSGCSQVLDEPGSLSQYEFLSGQILPGVIKRDENLLAYLASIRLVTPG
jgi:hypothetical protein